MGGRRGAATISLIGGMGTAERGVPAGVMEEPSPLARPVAPLARAIQKDDMRRLGLRRTGALARGFNRRGRHAIEFRRRLYEGRFEELLDEAGGAPEPRIRLEDGFALDTSHSLPHLDDLLAAGERLVGEYGGRKWEHEKPFLQNINPESAIDRYPVLLDFITTAPMLAAVTPTFGYIPALSGLLPRGVRLMESSTTFDPAPDGPWRESQLYHRDYHSTPTLYVIVALRDIGPDDGPLHFLGAEASRRVDEALDYGARGVPYRLTDEQVYSIVDPDEVHRFAMPAGTVLWIESSRCFHFGSRRPADPRYQIQYAFTSPVRNDFLTLWRPQRRYPVSPEDSELRRVVLDRSLLELD
jgi:hypothetical protein